MSQSWLSSLHSSISRSIKGDVIECTRVVCENRPLKCGLISVGESLCAKLLVLKYCRLLLLTLTWLSISSVSFLACTNMRTICVVTVWINIANMVAIATLVDIWEQKWIAITLLDRNKHQISKLLRKEFFLFANAMIIPWHDYPSPVYPSLQVQLWEPSVLVQFAVTSQAWLLLRHSSISSGTNDIDIEYFIESLSVWYLRTSS